MSKLVTTVALYFSYEYYKCKINGFEKDMKYGSPIIFLGKERSYHLSFRVTFKYRNETVFDFRKEIGNFRSHKSYKKKSEKLKISNILS